MLQSIPTKTNINSHSQHDRCDFARRCLKGDGVDMDCVLAFEILNQLAKEGHAEGQYLLGSMYDWGCFVPQNYLTAMKFYNCATAQSHAGACRSLGFLYLDGWGTGESNPGESFRCFKAAAKLGDADAMHQLGNFYQSGIWVKKFKMKSLQYYVKSANICHARRTYLQMFELSGARVTGWELLELWDERQSVKYMKAAAGSSRNYDFAQPLHVLNNGVEINIAKGKFKKNAFKINRKNFRGVCLLPDDVLEFGKKLASANAGDMVSQYEVALMYRNGTGVYKDNVQSWVYAKKSSGQKYAPAQYLMGELCGLQHEKYSTVERYQFYKDSSEQGYVPAIQKLGLISEITMPESKENDEKCELIATHKSQEIYDNYEKSAKAGDMYSNYMMGYMHHVGFRVAQNIETAKNGIRRQLILDIVVPHIA